MIWNWDSDTQTDIISTLIDNPAMEATDKVHAKQMVDHVARFLVHVVPPQKQQQFSDTDAAESEQE